MKMSHIQPGQLIDCSSAESFSFSFICPECGDQIRSKSVRFSKAGLTPETDEKVVIYKALYERERTMAQTLAVEQVGKHFSLCPICGRLVCDHCFLVCDDLDMCISCAGKLKEHGEPVLQRKYDGRHEKGEIIECAAV